MSDLPHKPERQNTNSLKVEQSAADVPVRIEDPQLSRDEQLAARREGILDEMRRRGERSSDIYYMAQRLELEPPEEQEKRFKAQDNAVLVAQAKEERAREIYKRSLGSSRPEPTRPKLPEQESERGPEKEMTDAASRKAARISQINAEFEANERRIAEGRGRSSNDRGGRE